MDNKISLAGDLGGGKSTVAKRLIAAHPEFSVYSTGSIMRKIADELGITIEELNRRAEKDRSIDNMIDDGLIALSSDPRSLIIDSRMAWHFVKDTFKVYLSCETEVSAARIMGAHRAQESFTSMDEAITSVTNRRASEMKRYSELYNVNIKDMANYNLIIDTTYADPDTVTEYLSDAYETWKLDHSYKMCYICPERLHYDSEEIDMDEAARISDDIDENRYVEEIEVYEDNGSFYINKGSTQAIAYSLSNCPYIPARLVPVAHDRSRDFVRMKTSL